jgi:hypothetical protein
MPGATLQYKWVKSHQDSRLPWHHLTLKEQLNTTCNTLANEAVTRALGRTALPQGPSLLPFESATVLIKNIKLTSNVTPTIRFSLGKVDARRIYTKAINRIHGSSKGGLGWLYEAFDVVDWEALAKAILRQLEGLQLWLYKQGIGV